MRKLLVKYKSLPIQVKSSLWFTVSNVMQKGIQFFTVPILTRIMPAADYGKYSLFLSWYQIVSIFATLNLWNYVMNNGMLKFEKDRNTSGTGDDGYGYALSYISFVFRSMGKGDFPFEIGYAGHVFGTAAYAVL